jgi:acyl carrier protein
MEGCCSCRLEDRGKDNHKKFKAHERQRPEAANGARFRRFPPAGVVVCYRFVNEFMVSIKEQLKPIILKSLRITDMTPADLHDDQPLLGGELEIDSIDILQLVLEIERHFGIKLVQGNFNQKHLESVNALAAIIESKVAEARA